MKTGIVTISDLHVGSSTGLWDKAGAHGPDAINLSPSRFQEYMWECWEHFFNEFVPQKLAGVDRSVLVVNGDVIDGDHHDTINLMTNSIQIQEREASNIIKKVATRFNEVYFTRGTEAHTQPGAQADERVAEMVGAVKDDDGNYARWQLWMDVNGVVFQFAHHIGSTASAAYESSAPMREMVAGLVEAAQWAQPLPDVFVRSHRHRFIEVPMPSAKGRIRIVITPAWQLRTPHVEKIDRMRLPHIGGVVFIAEDNQCQVYEKIYRMPNPQMVILR